MLTLFLILASLFGLVKSADIFVEQASALAKRFKISDFIIGFTIVAFGTSLPELISTIFSAFSGHNQLVIANIIGSNLANSSLIFGIVALFQNFQIKKRDVHINLPLNIAGLAGFWAILVVMGFTLNWIAGAFMLLLFALLIVISKNYNHFQTTKKKYVNLNYLMLFFSLFALIVSGKVCIDQTIHLSEQLHISETILGYFLLAIGTSLPELLTTWIAVKKRNEALGFGNILGSNIFNLLFILGLSTFIKPLQLANFKAELAVLTALSLLVYYYAISGKKYSFSKKEGLGLIIMYLLFIGLQIYKSQTGIVTIQ